MSPIGVALSKAEALQNYFADTPLQDLSSGDDTIVYREILPGIDLAYITLTHGIKEVIVLKEPTITNEFLFSMDSSMLALSEQNGLYTFVDENDETVFVIHDMFVVDQNGVEEKVDFSIYEKDGKLFSRISVDKEYLAASDRAWPVFIDPSMTITGGSGVNDVFVADGWTDRNFNSGTNQPYLRTGKDSPYGIRHSLIKFALPTELTIDGAVVSAKLRLRKTDGVEPTLQIYRATTSWNESFVTWNSKPGYSTSKTHYSYYDGSSWYAADVTATVEEWTRKGSTRLSNYGFYIRDAYQSSTSIWTTFASSEYGTSSYRPQLVVNYSTGTPSAGWYSDSNEAGYWMYTPAVYSKAYAPYNNNSQLHTALTSARSKWSLVKSTSSTSSEAWADISVYAIGFSEYFSLSTVDVDEALVSANTVGYTYGDNRYSPSTIGGRIYYEYDGSNVYIGIFMDKIEAFGITAHFDNIVLHELGHALGWIGHSVNSNDVMQESSQTKTTLTSNDTNHLANIYNLMN